MKTRKNKTKHAKASSLKPSRLPAFLVYASCLILLDSVMRAEAAETYVYPDKAAPVVVAEVPAPPPPLPVAAPEPVKATSTPPKPARRATMASARPSQGIKDTTADVCRRVGDNRVDILAEQGISPELFASTCYYDLLAMAYTESRFNVQAVGDGGKSRGAFQIQTALHRVSVADAENYAFAAEWTLDRMVRDLAYPRYRTAAIVRHNGAGDAAARYAASVKATADQFESAGL